MFTIVELFAYEVILGAQGMICFDKVCALSPNQKFICQKYLSIEFETEEINSNWVSGLLYDYIDLHYLDHILLET